MVAYRMESMDINWRMEGEAELFYPTNNARDQGVMTELLAAHHLGARNER
jgi:hypothetical protein